MKKYSGILLMVLALLVVASALRPAKDKPDSFALQRFGKLPVLEGGRIKPLDTVARNTVVFLRGKQRALLTEASETDGTRTKATYTSAVDFLADLAFAPEKAASYHVFRVDDPDVLSLLGSTGKDVRNFSYAELYPHFKEIERQAGLAPEEAAKRSTYERSVLRLREALMLYQRMVYSFVAPVDGLGQSHAEVYQKFASMAPTGMKAMSEITPSTAEGNPALREFLAIADRFRESAESSPLILVPPADGTVDISRWQSTAASALDAVRTHSIDAVPLGYAKLADAWRKGDVSSFNRELDALHGSLEQRYAQHEKRVTFESFFNHFQPFYVSTQLYVLVLLIGCLSWMGWEPILRKAAFHILVLALVIHTFGLVARMGITGYAPVTNLYSSAVFIGWAAVIFCLVLEAVFKNSMGSVAAGITGFCSLIIAHNLAVSGGNDTMEMMRAVLDSNFWLATHVTTVTIGYSATFLAGILGFLYLGKGFFSTQLSAALANDLERMIYGILCFALFFSFVGTVLGGIWADQSWGRFWGWDPKENGALMIVIWNALVLHAKRIRIAGQRGLVLLSLFGTVITSWSWFGTNMLGIGLHSYGFMDSVFFWLLSFWLVIGGLIALGNLDARFWRSGTVLAPLWNRGKVVKE
ncbi:MAG: cytochrome c biogenesis protein CcsA [Verrucomicrobiota bacterium]|nr:cytochrome c biogenesis protein CcsA [Verrucomicrobiota bacterium]